MVTLFPAPCGPVGALPCRLEWMTVAVPGTIKMIAIDIDGTLLPSAGVAVSRRNRLALLRAQAYGVEIVIATGRRQAYAMPLLEPLGLDRSTVIVSSNGTVTRTFAGDRIDRHFLPIDTARELCAVLRAFGGTTVFTFDKEGPGELALESLDALTEQIAPWVEANRPWIEEIRPLERAFDSGEPPVQGMVCGPVREMTDAENWLRASRYAGLIETHRTEYPARDLSILDVLPPGCSKGVALDMLARQRGLTQENVMAIGDNYNDIEMLEYAGHPVVMANAAPELLTMAQERGWQLAPANDDDGVGSIVEQVLDQQALRGDVVSATQ